MEEREEDRGELTGVSLTTYSSHRVGDIFDIFALEKNVDPIDPVHNKHELPRARMRVRVRVLYTIEKKGRREGTRKRKRKKRHRDDPLSQTG